MSAEKKLLLEVAERIGIDDEVALLSALGALAQNWQAMAADINGADSALALVASIAKGTEDASVAEAFKKVGADDLLATLKAHAARVTDLLDHVPEEILLLLNPIGGFDESSGEADQGLIRWPLLDKTVGSASEAAADEPSYSLSLAAGASLVVEAGAKWPYSDVVPGPLLRLRADGSLKPKARAALPFGASSIDVGASASAACAIEYFFAVEDPAAPYALALGERLTDLVDPFDFDAVWAGFTRKGLMGVNYAFDGSAAVEVSVSLADAGALAEGIKAEIGATLSVNFGLEGRYFLTFRAGPRGADGLPRIDAVLSREKKESLTQGIKFGGTIDLGGLATKLHAILKKALGQWNAVLQDITPYLSPGTLLRKEANELALDLMEDDNLVGALVRDLKGIVGTDEPDMSALADWLGAALTGGLDATQAWIGDQAAAADRLLDSLGRSLPAFAEDMVRDRLSGAASALVKQANDKLRTKVEALFDAHAAKLGKALKELNAVTDKKLDDVDAAFAGVRTLVERYDALFRKVLAATEDAARAKISIAVQIEEATISSKTVEIEGSFLSDSASAREAFRALTQGDLTDLLKLIDNGGSSGFLVDPGKSSLKRYASSTGKFGMEVLLFGFRATAAEIMSGEATVVVDGTGAIRVDTKGRLEKRFSGLDASREIELVSSYSLVRARALATAPAAADRSMGLSVTVGHVDKTLERHEVERFVGSLVDEALVRESARERAGQVFTRWAGSLASKGKLVANLQLKFALDRRSLGELLFLSLGEQGIGDAQRRLVVRRAFDALADGVPSRRPLIEQTKVFLAQRHPQRSLEDLLMDPSRTQRALQVDVTGSLIKRVPQEHEPFADAMRLAHGMLTMIERLRAIYFSTPEDREDDNPRAWSPADYSEAERDAVKAVREWLQLNAVLFWTNSEVHPRTIAFLQTIAALAKVDPLDAISLTMWRKDPQGSPETIVLSHAPTLV